MGNKIEIYNNGVIHREGDKMELIVLHERTADLSNCTNRMEVYKRPAGARMTKATLLTHISANVKYDHDFLRNLYTDAIINSEQE